MNCKGLIFDYGGTLDTNSVHWSEVLWDAYAAAAIPVAKAAFRDAYVHAERTLARNPVIQPGDTMLALLRKKVDVQTRYLCEQGCWTPTEAARAAHSEAVAQHCYAHVQQVVAGSRRVLQRLARRYPLALVSNFYGNLHAVLRDFRLELFQEVVESAVVGLRKPDPRLFRMGVEALGLRPGEVAVIGDSYAKDIVPAHALGCHTVWLRGRGWDGAETADETLPDAILSNINELLQIL